MKKSANLKNNFLPLIPVFGVICFVALYIIATFFYPGGSQVNTKAAGFSWANNYWCNLLNENAINGQYNPARPIAIIAMFILCASIAYFWYLFPVQIALGKYTKFIIQFSGAMSMVITVFIFTALHDTVINIASLFGLIALTGTFAGLYKIKSYYLFWSGIFNIFLVVLNNYFYYTIGLIIYLPIIQKITFLFFLTWLCCINIILSGKDKSRISIPDVKNGEYVA